MNREDALKKIKKCMALGRSAEPHEAAAAMRQAQKLMAEFRVTDQDLSLVDVREEHVKATSAGLNQWEARLVAKVAEAFGCEFFTSCVERLNAACNFVRDRFFVFVGLEGAAEVAGYAYQVLSRQCAKARLAHIARQPRNCKPITKTARGDVFAEAWVAGVSHAIERFAGPPKDEALLLAYMAEKHPNLGKAKVRDTSKGRRQDFGHAAAGFKAGQQAELNRGVSGTAPQGLLMP